ncbi:hypothetical protein [Pedobacter sp. GR22-6]|uniref:hypothetical protein n=1 Tax=Pedobacter sp. GR22-6 TaxID=3127957 RepID=UPI00307E8BCB
MKKILVLIITLFIAIVLMAYLYFSGLNADQKNSDSSLYAATFNSALVLSFENDKSIIDILSSQGIFREITGEEKYAELESIKKYLIAVPVLNKAVEKQAIFISLIPNGKREMDFLYSTQLHSGSNKTQLSTALKLRGLKLSEEQDFTRLTLPDSTVLYLGIKDHVLLLSSGKKTMADIMQAKFSNNKFSAYIKANNRVKKSSLAELYINFEALPDLLKQTMPAKLSGELAALDALHAFASLSYNFSKEKMLLTGITSVEEGSNYQKLFDKIKPQKISITNMLPSTTANHAIFALDNYSNWQSDLQDWFHKNKEDLQRKNAIENYNQKYRINLDQVFPKYFNNQFVSFQLSSSEKLGAISLVNGDKLGQLLLDLSTDYSPEIKSLREDNLLYYYFGAPFKQFKRPFYCIIDNYMVFANHPSTVQFFLNNYKNDQLLINDKDYSEAANQLANTANISYYISFENSTDIFRKNLYLPYYRQLRNEKGMKAYTAFIYQLSGDNGKFQTNILMSKKSTPQESADVPFTVDSLTSIPKTEN